MIRHFQLFSFYTCHVDVIAHRVWPRVTRFGAATVPVERRLAGLPTADFPQHHRLADTLRDRDWDHEFAGSLEALIAAIRDAVPGRR
jgi:hypothetical protein